VTQHIEGVAYGSAKAENDLSHAPGPCQPWSHHFDLRTDIAIESTLPFNYFT
jgi:hypothetical protein